MYERGFDTPHPLLIGTFLLCSLLNCFVIFSRDYSDNQLVMYLVLRVCTIWCFHCVSFLTYRIWSLAGAKRKHANFKSIEKIYNIISLWFVLMLKKGAHSEISFHLQRTGWLFVISPYFLSKDISSCVDLSYYNGLVILFDGNVLNIRYIWYLYIYKLIDIQFMR